MMLRKLLSTGGRFQLYIIAFLIIAIVLLGVSLSLVRSEVAIKESEIETLSLAKAVLQTDLDVMADNVMKAEVEKERLRQEAQRISVLNIANYQAKNEIETAFYQQSKQLDRLRNSNNDQVNDWANTPLPIDAARLLKQAANCARRDYHSDRICVAANGNVQRVSAAP